MHTITTALLVIAPILVLAQDARSCYWPNGTDVAAGNNSYFPCSSSGQSSCCLEGEACLSNGLCYGAEWGNTYRGACTDSTWTTSYCPQLCLADGDSIWPWANIFNCESGQWWCGGSGSTWCKAGTNAFLYNWSHGTVLGIATNSSGVLASSKSTSTATAASSSSTGSTVGSSSTSATASGSASAATATVTVTAAAAATTDDDKVSKSVPIGVGVGVGVPLALAAIAFAALWARERKKRIGAERSYSAPPKNQINMEYGGPPHEPNQTYDPPLHGRFAEADDGAGVSELAGHGTKMEQQR